MKRYIFMMLAAMAGILAACQQEAFIQSVTVTSEGNITEITAGESLQLSARVSPAKAVIDTIIWRSLDETKAIVDDKGLVTAVLSGEGTIQAEAVMAGSGLSMKGLFNLTVLMGEPCIIKQPDELYFPTGEDYSFSIMAAGENLSYIWEKSSTGNGLWAIYKDSKSVMSGTAGEKASTVWYRCTVSNDAGSVTSKPIEVNFQVPPTIVEEPVWTSGDNIYLVASGTALSYDWQLYDEKECKWESTTVNNGASSIRVFLMLGQEPPAIRCVVSNKVGSVTSKAILVCEPDTGTPTELSVSQTVITWDWDKNLPVIVDVTANKDWTAAVADTENWGLVVGNDGKNFMAYPKSKNLDYRGRTTTVSIICEDKECLVKCTQIPGPYVNGHRYVDLGLPSGVLWATCDLGAENPEDIGDLYGWGATTPYDKVTDIDWGLYFGYLHQLPYIAGTSAETCGKNFDPLKEYVNQDGEHYNVEGNPGISDGIGGSEFDAARQEWESIWRMPTAQESIELVSNCDVDMAEVNGHKVFILTSKLNGAQLTLPVTLGQTGVYGYGGRFWASTPTNDPSMCMTVLTTEIKGIGCKSYYRDVACPIRPVAKPYIPKIPII
ncbi:MAG: Ig-like domain-containing protein [Bacteroidales bacterium]|nr:Ig-like domain-containing protein [Bacteroidales bacterium]